MEAIWGTLTVAQAVVLLGGAWLVMRVADLLFDLVSWLRTRPRPGDLCDHTDRLERLINLTYDQREHLANIEEIAVVAAGYRPAEVSK